MNSHSDTQAAALEQLVPCDLDAGSIFSGQATGTKIKGFEAPSPFTPAVNRNYLFHEQARDLIVWFLYDKDPLYVFGPLGSGKTSLIKELAARLNYPVFEVTGHSRLEFPELIGHLAVRDGGMFFQYGPLALALKYGGLFLLNEIDLLDPSTAAGLNSILDGSPLCVPENGGEIIAPNPMFRFAATANTNGTEDTTGLYRGTLRQNCAFMDRFWLCEIGYPKPEFEQRLLEKTSPELPSDLRTRMVEFANEVRRLFVGSSTDSESRPDTVLDITFSTRTLLRWARLTVMFQPLSRQGISPILHSLERAVGFRAAAESRTFLQELAQRIFNTDYQPTELQS
ncbi:MAG: CbbQ/NirQ/NorQ/GpvN family protein [Deltaproteobacteria bacterium]|jgi:cobaltochelatase CobS|nr:CbbQ/NirQ/NorQ/GpvN family protein [Deltaproteobacteria bacterium]